MMWGTAGSGGNGRGVSTPRPVSTGLAPQFVGRITHPTEEHMEHMNKVGKVTRFSDRQDGTVDIFIGDSIVGNPETYIEIRCNEKQLGDYNNFCGYVTREVLEALQAQVDDRLDALNKAAARETLNKAAAREKYIWVKSDSSASPGWYGPYLSITRATNARALETVHSDGVAGSLTGPIIGIYVGPERPK